MFAAIWFLILDVLVEQNKSFGILRFSVVKIYQIFHQFWFSIKIKFINDILKVL